jgi:hypothetical protein
MRARSSISLFIGTTAIALAILPACFAACPDEIDRLQARLEARIASALDTARFARDARNALGLPLPAGSAIVGGKDAGDVNAWVSEAAAGIVRAREANIAGDVAACEEALVQVRSALDR